MIIRRPLSNEQRKILENKSKPTPEDIQSAQDSLFMYLMQKVEQLESELDQKKS